MGVSVSEWVYVSMAYIGGVGCIGECVVVWVYATMTCVGMVGVFLGA